jgi:hypothetical protein
MSTEKEYGTYDAPWTQTFDLAFLFMWIYALIGLDHENRKFVLTALSIG